MRGPGRRFGEETKQSLRRARDDAESGIEETDLARLGAQAQIVGRRQALPPGSQDREDAAHAGFPAPASAPSEDRGGAPPAAARSSRNCRVSRMIRPRKRTAVVE